MKKIKIPHALTLLFVIIILVSAFTYIIPAGKFERVLMEGRNRVIPNSYAVIQSTPVSFFDVFWS